MTNTSTPAVRTAVSPRYGVFSIHAAEVEGVGFDAFPLDPTLAHRDGLLGFYAEDVETLVRNIHDW